MAGRAPDAAGGTAPALRIQATCVAIDGTGVLIRGAPGSGKSDLALRLIDGGAKLVADDLVEIAVRDGRAVARLPADTPADCRGRLEVRGIGLLAVPSVAQAALALAVELVPGGPAERLPEPATVELGGIPLPLIRLDGLAASAPARVRLVLRRPGLSIVPGP